MSKTIVKNIIQGKLFCAIEYTKILQKTQINILLLKKVKSEFILEQENRFDKFQNIFKKFKKNQHLFLIINNEQVLTKFVSGKIEPYKAVQSAFPNLNSNDFYYETYQNEKGTFISICRKTYVNEIIEEYKTNDLHVIDFSLGNLTATKLLPYYTVNNIYTSNAILSIENKTLFDLQKSEEEFDKTYTINDLEINNNSVLSLGGILSYYTGQSTTQKSFDDTISELQNIFIQKRTFDLGLKIGLGLIFTLLLVNFLIFSNYNGKINIIKSEIQVNETYKGNLLSLKQEVDKKKNIVDKISSSGTSKVSQILDKIGISVPNSIQLNQIDYQPLLKNIKKDKEITYSSNILMVKGKSTNGKDFSNWITSLEQEEWIKSIVLINYGTGKKKSTEFLIKIIL